MAVRKRCMVSFVSYALFTMSSPGQTSLAYAETAGLRSGKSTHSSPSEKELALHIELEQTVIPTQALQTRQYATISPQLSDLKTVVQDSPATGGSRRSRRRLTKSTLSGRQDTRRQSRTELRLLYVFLTVTLGIYLTKYLSRCVLPPRPAGLSSNTTLPGLQHLKAGSPLSDSLSSSSGRVRRLAASEGSDGSGESRKTMGSQEESKDPICDAPSMSENLRRVQFGNYVTSGYGIGGLFGGAHSSSGETGARGYALGVADVQAAGDNREPANVVAESASEFLEGRAPPGSRHAEASILRLVATQVMNAAATASAALPKTCHSTTCLRQALQLMSETYGMLLEEAGTLESPPSGSGDKTQSVDNPSDSGTPAAREKTSPLEHNFNSHSAERMSGSTSDAKSDEAQPVHAGRPVSLDMQLWRRLDFSLGTIFEAEDAEQDGGDDGDVGIERRSSFFTLSGRSGDDEDDTQPSTLEEAMSIVGMDEGMVGGWNPFSSTTSTSDAWGKFVTDQSDARETAGDDANDVTGGPPRRPSYSEVLQHPPARSHSAPPRSTAANGQGMAKRVAGLGQRLTSSGQRQSATSRDVSGGRRHYPSGPRVPGRRPTNRFESIDRSASHRRAGARPSLPSRPPPKPPLPQISKVGFGASGTPVQRGASQGGTPSGSEKRDGGEPSKDVKGQGEDAGQPGASGGPLGGAGGGGRRPGDDERDDDKRKKGKGSSSGGGEKKKEEQEKKAKKERDQREEAKKESKPVDGREARGKEVKQGGGGLSSDSGKGSTGEEAGKKKAKKDRGRRAIEGTAGDVTDAGVTSEATGGVPKEAEPQKDGEDRGVHGGGRGGEGPGSAGATETGDALQHDSGGIGSGSEDRDKSRSETAAREKQDSKRQKSSGGRRKKKGASVAPQTGQTTTGEAPRSAVDSEGGRAGPLAASDKNKAGTDEGGRDAKGDEDGEAATAGPRAGAQHTGEHGGETEVVGETVKVAEADEEGSDAAAQREALRTGARPKTSSAAGRRKQKVKEHHAAQAESVSTRVSAAAEDQEVPSRGRARHRTRAPDTRAGTGGSQKGVKASLGPSDGKGGQDGDVTVMSGKVTKNPVEKTSRPLSVGYDAMVASLQDKYLSIVAAYETRLRMFQAEPGVKCFMDLVDSPAFHERLFSPVEFHLLTKLLLLNEEFVCQLDSLCAVARGLHMKALEQSRAERLHKFTVDAKAKRGATKTSPFSSILSMISARGRAAHDVSIRLLRAETTQRCKIISLLHMPPFREAVLPSFVKGEAYDPDSDEILYTSEGVTLRAADPLSGVELLRDQLQHWLPLVAPAVAAVETQWWIPPSDPDEAKRQHERTEAVFHAAALFVTSNAFKNAAEQWKTSSPEMTVSDPDLKAKVETAVLRLRSYSEEAVQQMGQQLKLYAQSFRQTARANLRNPQNRWDPLPDSSHAPDIRGAAEYEARNAPGESAAAKEQATTVADVPKTQDDQGGDGPAS